MVSFAKGSGSSYGAVRSLLVDEAVNNRLEFMTLLDASATILVNAGAHNRTGESWDPHGIVSRVARKPKYGQVGRRRQAGRQATGISTGAVSRGASSSSLLAGRSIDGSISQEGLGSPPAFLSGCMTPVLACLPVCS